MRVYVVVDVGCIECGEPTSIAGIYRSEVEALARRGQITGAPERETYFAAGQHHVVVIEAEAPS